jgi:hypothetical protein
VGADPSRHRRLLPARSCTSSSPRAASMRARRAAHARCRAGRETRLRVAARAH